MSTRMNRYNEIDAVILANGDYPSSPLPLKVLSEAPYVVCCDGGADEYIAKGHLPDIIIGDGDSLSEENRLKHADLLHHNPDQETNDQTKAVQFLLSEGNKRIAIVGATGKPEFIQIMVSLYHVRIFARSNARKGVRFPSLTLLPRGLNPKV